MADLNGNTLFATTGQFKDFIAWLNFTQRSDLLTSGPLTVKNVIPGGYTIEFTIEVTKYNLEKDSAASTKTPYINTFGYLGKNQTYNLLPANPFFAIGGKNIIVKFTNIVVKKEDLELNDYLFVIGDGEATNTGGEWTAKSNGVVWQRMDKVINVQPGTMPIVTGLDTTEITLKGDLNTMDNFSTNIFQLHNVKDLTITYPIIDFDRVVAGFGVVVTLPPNITKTANQKEIENKVGNYATFTASFTPTDSSIITYSLIDIINPSTGLSYISKDSLNTPRTTITQGGNPVTATETINGSEVTFDIPASGLILDIPVEINLVYQLTEVLQSKNIYNKISITAESQLGQWPTLYADATIILLEPKPVVEKSPEKQEVLIKDGESVNFTIKVSNLEGNQATQNYKIIDQLDPHLSFDQANTSLTLTIGNVTTPLPLNFSLDSNNLLTVTVLSNLVPLGGILTLNIATKVINSSTIQPKYRAVNSAYLLIDDDQTKRYNSNEVYVLFVTMCYRALSNVVESIALQEAALSHIINAEGEKIQKLLKMTNITRSNVTAINNSVNHMIGSISLLEVVLTKKLSIANGVCNTTIPQIDNK
ncbi:MAG: isopeptide-forming domain-containing fimbrial protein [Clostridium sp.]